MIEYRKSLEPDNIALWEDRKKKEKLYEIKHKISDYIDSCEYLFVHNIITLWDFRCNLENIIPLRYLVKTAEEKIKVKETSTLKNITINRFEKPNSMLLSRFVDTANSLLSDLYDLSSSGIICWTEEIHLLVEDVEAMENSITEYNLKQKFN